MLIKDVLDRALAAVALVVLAPVLMVVAAAIRLDSPGPILFRQRRHGRDLEEFVILKFRTMHVEHCRLGDTEVVQAWPGDARVSRVGRFLRQASLDELPQLLNVLQGSMSLVGPRPHPLPFIQIYGSQLEHYSARHVVKPGITGLAQVHGWRGETRSLGQMAKRLEHDLRYIETWSLWLDVVILLSSVTIFWRRENAY